MLISRTLSNPKERLHHELPYGCGDFGVPTGHRDFSRRFDLTNCLDGHDVLMPRMQQDVAYCPVDGYNHRAMLEEEEVALFDDSRAPCAFLIWKDLL